METNMILYHGSKYIITRPEFGTGYPYNDYGRGFYCTESPDLAREWACFENRDGFANKYAMDLKGLSVLKLTDGSYNILNWLSILLANRKFSITASIARQAKNYLLNNFLPEYEDYDIIIGYRADDSYFSFASAFLHNTISLNQLEKAMYLGKLGEQIVLKSEEAFSRIKFIKAASADATEYYAKRLERDTAAREAFKSERNAVPEKDAVYMIDILREEWKDDDSRIRRIVSE